jgi:hypothetical protein
MTTVYVAAEKLVTWSPDGQVCPNKNLIDTILTHCQNNRFVVYFAPARFGLMLEDRCEVEDAWHYFERSLRTYGFHPHNVILFDEEVDEVPFVQDQTNQDMQNSISIIFSDNPNDEKLSLSLGIRKVSEIPSNISSMWQKISIRRALRTFVAAAIHP